MRLGAGDRASGAATSPAPVNSNQHTQHRGGRAIFAKAHSDRRHGCRNLPAQTRPCAPWPIDLRFAHLRHPEAGICPA
jgi:hypothetical protein